jgi:hypothetical protein
VSLPSAGQDATDGQDSPFDTVSQGVSKHGFLDISSRYQPSPEGLSQLISDANDYGLPWRMVGGSGSIDFGNGMVVDVVQGFSEGGNYWQWHLPGSEENTTASSTASSSAAAAAAQSSGTALAGTSTALSPEFFGRPPSAEIDAVPLSDFGGPQFDDPGAALLEDLLKVRIQELFQPVENPALSTLIQTLQGHFDTSDTQLSRLLEDIGVRVDELRADPFTRGEEELFRTRALDKISSTQDADTRRLLEVFGSLGRAPTSGVNAEMLRRQAVAFGGQRTQAESAFAIASAQLKNQRLDQALGLSGQLRNLDMARRGERVNLSTQLAAIEQQIAGQEQARRREAITSASALSEMPERRLQLALAALDRAPAPASQFANFAQLAQTSQGQQGLALQLQQLQQQQQQFNAQSSAQFFAGLAGLFDRAD